MVDLMAKWGVGEATVAVLLAAWRLSDEEGVCEIQGVEDLLGEGGIEYEEDQREETREPHSYARDSRAARDRNEPRP